MGKNDSLSEAKRKSVNRRRFLILFLVWLMFIGLFSGIIGVGFKDNETVRIVMFSLLGVATLIYWAAFFIIFRRQRQKGNK